MLLLDEVSCFNSNLLDSMDVLRGSKAANVELPHSRFIPESDRAGWREGGSGSNTPASSSYVRRHSSILHLGSIWSSPMEKLRSMVPHHAVDTFDTFGDDQDTSEEEEGQPPTGHGRERSNSMPSSIRSGESRPFFSSAQTATSSVTLISIQMPPDRNEVAHNQDQQQTPFVRPNVVPGLDTTASTSLLPSGSNRNSRGYPWRGDAVGERDSACSFYVPPSHRNATGSQAFYDTHFGSSSNWRSVAGMADDAPYRLMAKNVLGKWTARDKKHGDQESKTAVAVDERKRSSILRWHSLNSLGSLGLSNFMTGSSNSSNKRSTSGAESPRHAYEPVLLPSIHRDPHASRYFKNLAGNVVVLGGYRGSVLRDSETHQMMWVPLRVGAGLRRPSLLLGLTPEAENCSEDFVVADEMLGNISSMVDMGKRLIHRCSTKRTKVYSWGYDWRLSLGRSSKRLDDFLYDLWVNSADKVEDRKGAQVIAHSMGGLVALHALTRSVCPEAYQSLVFASTPFLGTANILGPMRFGDIAMFNDEICSPRATFSFRSSFYLLPVEPLDLESDCEEPGIDTRGGRCFEEEDGTPIDVDFLDAETWNDLGLSPCVALGKRKEVLSKSRNRAKREGLSLDHQLERSASIRQDQGLDHASYNQAHSSALPSFVMGLDMNMTSPPASPSAIKETAKVGQKVLDHTVSGVEDESTLQCANRQQSDKNMQRKDSILSQDELAEVLEDEASESWLYLEHTLAETRQFFHELRTGFNDAFYEQGRYPPMAVITSGSTPTVRGALVKPRGKGDAKDAWKDAVREGDYSRMLYAPGDGVILKRSSIALPGKWAKMLVKGREGDSAALTNHEGVVETNHRHIALLSDVDGVGRCLEACRRARMGAATG